MKEQRWYQHEGEFFYIYDSPIPQNSKSCSVVRKQDLKYYRDKFILSEVYETDYVDEMEVLNC